MGNSAAQEEIKEESKSIESDYDETADLMFSSHVSPNNSTVGIQFFTKHRPVQKCIIYWDYENCPISRRVSCVGNVINVIKDKINKSLNIKIPFEIKAYINPDKVRATILNQFEVNGITIIYVASKKPESVDKRMLVDMALDLYDWSKSNSCKYCVVLLSGDQDFGNILSRIQHVPEIYKLILMRLPNGNSMNISNVDVIIDDFTVEEFITCTKGKECMYLSMGKCNYYHPRNVENTRKNKKKTGINTNQNNKNTNQNNKNTNSHSNSKRTMGIKKRGNRKRKRESMDDNENKDKEEVTNNTQPKTKKRRVTNNNNNQNNKNT
eukprot:380148_1